MSQALLLGDLKMRESIDAIWMQVINLRFLSLCGSGAFLFRYLILNSPFCYLLGGWCRPSLLPSKPSFTHLSFSAHDFAPHFQFKIDPTARGSSHCAQEQNLDRQTVKNLKKIPIRWSSKLTSSNAAEETRNRSTDIHKNRILRRPLAWLTLILSTD